MREFNSIGVVSLVQSRFVPLVACLESVLLRHGERVRHPLRLAPAEQVNRDIRVDRKRVSGEHEACAARYVRFLVLGAHYGRLCAGGGIYVCSEFNFDVRQTCAVIRLEQQVHYLPVCLWILRLVVHEKPRGVVSSDCSQTAVNGARVHVYGASVNGYLLVLRIHHSGQNADIFCRTH